MPKCQRPIRSYILEASLDALSSFCESSLSLVNVGLIVVLEFSDSNNCIHQLSIVFINAAVLLNVVRCVQMLGWNIRQDGSRVVPEERSS